MKLLPLVTLRVDLRTPLDLGSVPLGHRLIIDVSGGTFEGERMRGKVLPSGGDWLIADEKGVWRLDVRLALQTEDGALLFLQYLGILVMTDAVMAGFQAGRWGEFGATYFMTQPRFETGDGRYAWLNNILAAGEGRLGPQCVEYRIFALATDQTERIG